MGQEGQHKRYLKDDAKREQEERYKGEVAVSRDQLCKAIGCEVDEPLHRILQHDVAKRDTYQEEHYAYENEWNGCFFLFIIQSRRDKGPDLVENHRYCNQDARGK